MDRKIEIELPQELYQRLEEQCKNKELTLEEYIIFLLYEGEHSKNQVQHIKKVVIGDLQNMIYKVQKTSLNPSNRVTQNEVNCIPLKAFKGQVPKDLKKKIDFFKKQKTFKEDYFYLLINPTEVVGYSGLDFFEEAMPYGQYGFIYCFDLQKPYLTYKNLKNIFNFLGRMIKEEKIYNMDLSTICCNIPEEVLAKLGFKELSHVKRIYGGIKPEIEYDTILQYKETTKDFNVKEMEGLLPINRVLPISYLQNYWMKSLEVIKLKEISFKQTSNSFILQERKRIQDKIYFYYTIFLNPLDLYDRDVLREIYHILIKEINMEALGEGIIIDIPIEIKDILVEYMTCHKEHSIYWYRKLL
ncbi:hypothetical protein CACET_c17550 [Clostridium aceticum]|uniref:Uncharacterized protein n=1 Tax=Clostridium aceticum TaxID=84022 RepID=A0A0D8IDL2_9CLOT|nr:hypothetical protein [Clostridium aceticum]AKL95203.1 hypothetical protein CACET_c17550 [Clostridium aceticum]KJF28072.1 hypothetical protein TZ02_05815 [Clostridium aceticum]